ncbi:hypothetical protein BCR33DRAFT_779128 [Rhizoclosmatium globosum]|uniref:Uncharacterized protein n=1 Tax=Rhizoclosmatium globosum TaxID=329046 RepID=A0A1Y2D3D1_9FUNG|nr:hypothetical protein BCR33DRAFT_779128 [Rhizoclosmatium globosum]|eukprot:ORY53803.1 hypothetical protein BCR33DRAFT_779128 [Rhizoclosmatium globosum]
MRLPSLLFVCLVVAVTVLANCPLKEKCPYVKYSPTKHGDDAECPLKKAGCPYYDHHAKDKSLADYLTEQDGKCPLDGKCPFYQDLKDGKKVDLSGNACPLKDKCPYYKTIKSHGDSLDCPLEKSWCVILSYSLLKSSILPFLPISFNSTLDDTVHTSKRILKTDVTLTMVVLYSANNHVSPYLKSHKTRQDDAEKPSCPMKGKCPYADKHHVKHGEGCPLKEGGCPYYKKHADDASAEDLLHEEEGCPLKKGGCPYYDDVKSGKQVDLSGNGCPLAEKCPYYKEAKEHGGESGCPLAKKCPHFNKDATAKSGEDGETVKECPYRAKQAAEKRDDDEEPVAKCPLKGNCPYATEHHAAHDGSGCPLKKGGCPYYNEHAKDGDVADMLQHEGGCPLKEKCPYYEAIKNGEKVDFTGTKCPLAEKCPYYKEVKGHGPSADCPLEKSCPHFKKDFEKGGHAHHGGKHDSHDAKDWFVLSKDYKPSNLTTHLITVLISKITKLKMSKRIIGRACET